MTDNIAGRGTGDRTPLGTAVFVGLRALDAVLIQRIILQANPLTSIVSTLSFSSLIQTPSDGSTLSFLGQTVTPFQTVIWSMSIGSALKQIYHAVYVNNQPLYVSGAIMVAIFNTIVNGINTALFTAAGSNSTWSPRTLQIGSVLYVIGLLVEAVSETQRKWFKDDPRNKGKPFAGGLFAWARNINYFGYTIWRTGFAMASGGSIWAAVVGAFFTYDFCTRGIPILDEYCAKRYGAQWEKVKQKVPYRFVPGIW